MKDFKDIKLNEKIELLSTQIEIELDLQQKHKKHISELTLKLRESSERYSYLETRYQALFTNNNVFSEMIKDLQKSVEEKVFYMLII